MWLDGGVGKMGRRVQHLRLSLRCDQAAETGELTDLEVWKERQLKTCELPFAGEVAMCEVWVVCRFCAW